MDACRSIKSRKRILRWGKDIIIGVLALLGAFGAVLADAHRSEAMAQLEAQVPFDQCPEHMYVMRTPTVNGQVASSTTLSVVDTDNEFALNPIGTAPNFTYNAGGFNEVDNYIYATRGENNGPGILIRIDRNGKVEDVVPQPPGLRFSSSAEVGPGGFMYLLISGYIYRLDLNNPGAPGSYLKAKSTAIPADVAYHNGFLYGVELSSQKLIRFNISEINWKDAAAADGDLATVAHEYININNTVYENGPVTAGNWGAMFGGSNGVYGNNNAGGFYSFDLTTGIGTRLAESPETAGNDGAKCFSSILRVVTDVRLSKTSYPDVDEALPTFIPGEKTQYRITLSNHKTTAVMGINLVDALPAGITNATWHCENTTLNPAFDGCRPSSGTGPLDAVVDLVAAPKDGSISVSYIVEIEVPQDYQENIVNTVIATLPEVSSQERDGPLTATLTKMPGILSVEKIGHWIDTDKSNGPNVGDEIEYTFTVTNGGQSPLTDVKIIDSMVVAEPASVASLAPGEVAVFTARYTVTQEDLDNTMTENTATTQGNLPDGSTVESPPSTAIVEFPPELGISTEKSGRFLDDLVPNEFPDVGEHLEFAVKVKNSGNVSMVAYPPIDQGPTINGKPMTGELSAFSPDMHTIPPGGEAVFTALYTLTEQDVNEASGVLDGVANTVDTPVQTLKEFREGAPVRNHPLEKPNVMSLPGYAIDKQAQVGTVTRGMMVPYVIKVRPIEASGEAMLVDQLPVGFSYVPGSARMDGVPVQPKIEGRTLTMDFEAENGVEKRIEYMLVVTGAVALGTFENTAQVFLPGQPMKPVSRKAIAEVDVVPDPVFDCGTVVGAVFDDQNRNGYQDKGEKGLAGARIVSVDGVLVTTDAHGRFNVACADLPDGRVGKTYLMKLDPRSLPTGYRILSENPRSVRLTAGKVSKLSFAASIGRVVRLDIDDHAFLPGEVNLQPQWESKLADIIELLRSEPTIFRIVYKAADTSQSMHTLRLKKIKEHLSEEWKSKGNIYRLEVESKIMYANK